MFCSCGLAERSISAWADPNVVPAAVYAPVMLNARTEGIESGQFVFFSIQGPNGEDDWVDIYEVRLKDNIAQHPTYYRAYFTWKLKAEVDGLSATFEIEVKP